MNDPLAISEIKRFTQLSTNRKAVFDSDWQRISQYLAPEQSDINETKTEGLYGWTDQIYDTTGIEAARTCTSGFKNWVIPATEPWFALEPPSHLEEQDENEAAIWCGKATEVMLHELSISNFNLMMQECLGFRTIFGTGAIIAEEGTDTALNFRSLKIATYSIAENAEGLVDTLYRDFGLTARQAKQQFPDADLGPTITEALKDQENDSGKPMAKFPFLHVIRPRQEIEKQLGNKLAKNKAYASIYISIADKHVVDEGGYDEKPMFVTRFAKWGTDNVWGYGPGYMGLPDVRQLNYAVRVRDASWEVALNPRILTPIGLAGQVDLRAGGETFFDPNGGGGELSMPRTWGDGNKYPEATDALEEKRTAIGKIFFNDVFNALGQPELVGKKMTAYEISQRVGEKLERLSPSMERITTEVCNPLIMRVFGMLFRMGKFEQPPSAMLVPTAGGRGAALAMPNISYTSRLALALKALQNKAIVDGISFMSEFAVNNQRPDVFDNISVDATFRKMLLNGGFPAELVSSYKDMLAVRQQRAQQAAQQQALMAAEQASKAVGNLAKVPAAFGQDESTASAAA